MISEEIENLLMAIIKQACDDWVRCNRSNIKLNRQLQNAELSLREKMSIKDSIDRNNNTIKETENFLRSDFYSSVCSMSCEKLLRMLSEKVESM